MYMYTLCFLYTVHVYIIHIYPYVFISVGAKLSPDNTSELKFLYEGHQDFSVIPSFAVIPAFVSSRVVLFT